MNRYLDGMMGLVIGDALGVPYEFKSRSMLKEDPCTTMRGQGTYNLPAGFFSDDSSMALACLDALKDSYDLYKIMDCFILNKGRLKACVGHTVNQRSNIGSDIGTI